MIDSGIMRMLKFIKPNLKCIAWNFDGSIFVSDEDKKEDLKRLRFENGDVIPDVKSYFA
jgi:hypothetical protein